VHLSGALTQQAQVLLRWHTGLRQAGGGLNQREEKTRQPLGQNIDPGAGQDRSPAAEHSDDLGAVNDVQAQHATRGHRTRPGGW
jgi:hypothetical protein